MRDPLQRSYIGICFRGLYKGIYRGLEGYIGLYRV